MMKAITKFRVVLPLVAVIGLALAGLHKGTSAPSQDNDDDRRTVDIPLGSTGLTIGEGLRTTLTNLGPRRISAQIRVIDSDGAIVKQETLELEPGQMRTIEMSRSEVSRDERSVIVRTEVMARRSDGRNLWMTSEVIEWSSGSTRFLVSGTACPSWMCGSGNHNETMMRDRMPMK
jgi:hypothetical protein